MIATPFKAALLAITLAFAGSAAHATTIDFDSAASPSGVVSYYNSTYSTAGYDMKSTANAWIFSSNYYAYNSYVGNNGTPYYMLGYDSVTVTSSAGTPFSISSLDLGNFAGYGYATLTGTFADGTTIVTNYLLNNDNTATVNDFITENLIGFTNLKSFTISAVNSYLQVDNIVINAATAAVPEPASLALLGLGLAAIGAVRRKKAA